MNQEIDDIEGDAYAVGDYNTIVACPTAADILWDQKPNFWNEPDDQALRH